MAASQGKSVSEVASQGLFLKIRATKTTDVPKVLINCFFFIPRSWTCVYCLSRSPFEVTASSVLVGNLLSYVDHAWFG